MRHALRSLGRDRLFAFLAVGTLAIGIGATTAAFTYLASFLWSEVKLREPDRLISFSYRTEGPGALGTEGSIPYPDLLDYRREGRDAAELVGMRIYGAPISIGRRQTVWSWGHAVSEAYFEVLGVEMALGRSLAPEDHQASAPRSVVLADRFWLRHFERSPDVLGQVLEIGGQRYTVVGVAPKGFRGTGAPADLYTPLVHAHDVLRDLRFDDRAAATVFVSGRLAPGVTVETAESRFAALAAALDREWPNGDQVRRPDLVGSGISVRSLWSADAQSGGWFRRSILLFGSAGLLLFLCSANVANLLIARYLARGRELRIRAALGASRGRLTAGLLFESVAVAAVAGALGVALSRPLVGVIRRYLFYSNPVDVGHWSDGVEILPLDWRVVGFTVGASVCSVLLFGLWPALRASRSGSAGALIERSGTARFTTRGRRTLVVLQVAMSALLLTGSVLLVRSLSRIWSTDPGFDTRNLLVASFALDTAALDETQARAAYHEVEAVAAAIPGVETVSLTSFLPLGGGRSAEVHAAGVDGGIEAAYTIVSPAYFETLRLPLLAGRPFDRERLTDAPGAVVSAGLAAKLWPDADPMDRLVRLRVLNREEGEYRVVGVAADARFFLTSQPRPAVYLSFDQVFRQQMSLVARSAIPPAALLPLLRRSLERAHPRIALIAAATFEDHVGRSLALQRLESSMGGIIAVLALLMAASGIASLLTYLVRARRRDLAVRVAVGAQPRDLLLRVLGEAGAMVGLGALLGLAAAVGLTRLLRAVLFEIAPLDPWSFATAAVVMVLVGLLAALGPALAASRVAPTRALREE